MTTLRGINSASQSRRSGFPGLFLCCVESQEQPLHAYQANTIPEEAEPKAVESGDSDEDAVETFQFIKDYRNASMMENGNKNDLVSHTHYSIVHGCLFYHENEAYFSVNIHQITIPQENVGEKDENDDALHYLRGEFLPDKKLGFETKPLPGLTPKCMENFTFDISSKEEVQSCTLLLRLMRMGNDHTETLIGHQLVSLAAEDLSNEEIKQIALDWPSPDDHFDGMGPPAGNISGQETLRDSASLRARPELQISLQHSDLSGRLTVEILRGVKFFIPFSNRKPADSFVKLVLMSSTGKEISHSKTTVFKCLSDPAYNERFLFSVASFQLSDVTLMFTVYHKKSMNRKDTIGWFALGLNSSGQDEFIHWHDVRTARGQPVIRWHALHLRS